MPVPMPTPSLIPRDRTLRFRVADDEGRSSLTWVVKATGREVYVGNRNLMGLVKLSLHSGGGWRFARTTESVRQLPRGASRDITVWEPTPEFVPGWQFGAEILVPGFALMVRQPGQDNPKTLTFPSSGPQRLLKFMVVLSDEGAEDLTLNPPADDPDANGVYEVGRIVTHQGRRVWVVLSEHAIRDDFVSSLDQALLASGDNGERGPDGTWAWGTAAATEAPSFIDVGQYIGERA